MFGKIKSYSEKGQIISIEFEKMPAIKTYLEIINEDIIRVYACLERVVPSFAIENLDRLKVKNVLESIEFTKEELIIKTKKLIIKVLADFKIDIYDLALNLICEDYKGSRNPFIRHAISLSESEKERQLAKETSNSEGHLTKDYFEHHKIEVLKTNFKNNVYFGLGEKTGFLNKKGYEYEMWNTDDPSAHLEYFKSLYKSIPFFITLNKTANDIKTYGIFFDNTYRTYFDMGKENDDYIYFGSDRGNLDYYFIYGKDLKEVVRNYTLLTGKTPLPKRKTLGHHQSRWSYGTSERVDQIIEGYQKNDIPLDFIHLDIDYMDSYKIFTYDEKRFPDFKNLIKKWQKKNIDIITIIDPGTKAEDGYQIYEEGKKHNLFLTKDKALYLNRVWPGTSAYPDFSKQETYQWWKQNQKIMTDLGVSGIWNDMNEPASFDGPLPDDVEFDNFGLKSTHLEMHNVYALLMAKATYDGLKEHTLERPFVITRAAYAGTQKYSTFWTGDNQSLWIHLQMALPMLCNMGLSGLSFVGTDVGGFGGDVTKELLCRWVQVGAFSPLFRNHASMLTKDQEPFAFDQETMDIYRKAVKLRYKFIPYFYDLFFEGEQSGLPVLRPLVLNYPNDEKTYNLNDEFMIGDYLLVSPIIEQGKVEKMVYLPEGRWFDSQTGMLHNGNNTIIKKADLSMIPLYYKEGSIIPNYPEMNNIPDLVTDIIFDIYPGNNTYYHFYDDGKSFAYRDGKYTLYKIKMIYDSKLKINISFDNDQYLVYKKMILKIHLPLATTVKVDGKETPFIKCSNWIELSLDGGEHYLIIQ